MIGEIWKDIIGYKGLYMVSNFGRVKALSKTVMSGRGYVARLHGDRIMKVNNTKTYSYVILQNSKQIKSFLVHRVVALLFIPNPENKPQINHIDGNKNNNHVDNLEWCTRSENMRHAHKNGLVRETKYRGLLRESDVLKIKERLRLGEKYKSIAMDYNCHIETIGHIKRRTSWGHLA